jgi:hypothetical protein
MRGGPRGMWNTLAGLRETGNSRSKITTEIRRARRGIARDIRLTELLAWHAQVHNEEWVA